MRGLERKPQEEQLGLLSLGEMEVTPPWAPQPPPEEQQSGRYRSLHPQRHNLSDRLNHGRFRLPVRTGFSPRGWSGPEQAPQGQAHNAKAA